MEGFVGDVPSVVWECIFIRSRFIVMTDVHYIYISLWAQALDVVPSVFNESRADRNLSAGLVVIFWFPLV